MFLLCQVLVLSHLECTGFVTGMSILCGMGLGGVVGRESFTAVRWHPMGYVDPDGSLYEEHLASASSV